MKYSWKYSSRLDSHDNSHANHIEIPLNNMFINHCLNRYRMLNINGYLPVSVSTDTSQSSLNLLHDNLS